MLWVHCSYTARDASTCTPASDVTRGAVCTDWRRAFAATAPDPHNGRPPRHRSRRACLTSPRTRAFRRRPLSLRGYARRWWPSTASACAQPWRRRMLSRGARRRDSRRRRSCRPTHLHRGRCRLLVAWQRRRSILRSKQAASLRSEAARQPRGRRWRMVGDGRSSCSPRWQFESCPVRGT